jgi:hypothetical protein
MQPGQVEREGLNVVASLRRTLLTFCAISALIFGVIMFGKLSSSASCPFEKQLCLVKEVHLNKLLDLPEMRTST